LFGGSGASCVPQFGAEPFKAAAEQIFLATIVCIEGRTADIGFMLGLDKLRSDTSLVSGIWSCGMVGTAPESWRESVPTTLYLVVPPSDISRTKPLKILRVTSPPPPDDFRETTWEAIVGSPTPPYTRELMHALIDP
jgi:hypothetical protein